MAKSNARRTYYDLTEHDTVQVFSFIVIIAGLFVIILYAMLPLLNNFFVTFLHGKVYNSGAVIPYYLDAKEPLNQTSYLFSWGVDIYIKTPSESRYWFNPVLALSLQAIIIAVAVTFAISALLPVKYGYIRQKIDREILNLVEKISLAKFGYESPENTKEIIEDFLNADLRDLNEYLDYLEGISLEDLKVLQKALKWNDSDFLYKLIHVNDGITMYMRFHFTVKFANSVLGFVYIGAAMLIIIIGLRGLKFIPPTQPSLVLFALGLEFSLLITYAFTLMYTKQDDNTEYEKPRKDLSSQAAGSSELGSGKEIEKLLRVFIKSPKKN